MAIPARVSLTTLGVGDFAMMRAFYEGLGWRNMNPGLPSFAAFDTGARCSHCFHTACSRRMRAWRPMRRPRFAASHSR